MKIVIIGGGFGGLNLVKELSKNKSMEITLVDKNNYHFFAPLIYQVSTSFIEPSTITYPFRRMFQEKKNLRFHLGSLQKINSDERTIDTDTGTLSYDYLVLAMGTESNFFGLKNIEDNALPLKTIDDALNLRNHLLLTTEKAVRTTDKEERKRLMNIVIAGGGPTGVEVSGMLAEMGRNILKKEYPELRHRNSNLYLIDAAPTLLGPMSRKSQEEAYNVLKKLGVKIILGVTVKDYINHEVILGNGEKIPTETLVWTSGVVAREASGLPKESLGKGRRLLVDEFNKVKHVDRIFAIGDICLQTSDKNYPEGHPQLAQVALQQSTLLAANLNRTTRNAALKPFSYYNKGSMAIIAKYKAVVDLPFGFFKGFVAWLVWLFIHLIPIAGFRNKVKLAFSWMWSFITNDPALRLIIRPGKEQ